ncbi:dde superfamily endonuclease [Holotrichia oblita]|uniref:Dde superfamily endonuclease n=1 Tax=Holotrichia oblita TaxID=644536 RepID=A0ACB9TJ11_HOLOL|nr:dde superfamily endonuclease [Holotrichia oblita]
MGGWNHFVQRVKPSNENKVLLILNGHSSHKGLEVLEYTKSNGIILFCLPAHCFHLDVGFFAPLQTYYNQEVQKWLKRNPGRAVTHFQVTELFNNAYPPMQSALKKKSGISPLDPDIFVDWEFGPASTTDNEKAEAIIYNMTEKNRGKGMPNKNMNDDNNNKANSEILHDVEVDQNVAATSVKNISIEQIEELSPLPKVPRRDTKRKGKRFKNQVSSTPLQT